MKRGCTIMSLDKAQNIQMSTVKFATFKKARQIQSKMKTLMIIFFVIQGLVCNKFVPTGQPNEVLIRFRAKVQRKWLFKLDGLYAMAILLLTLPFSSKSFWSKDIPVVPTLCIHLILLLAGFFSSLKRKLT